MVIINESGLYSLILSSKLPQAKEFKRWVTSEVLPQIRKTGGYIPTRDAEGRELSGREILERADAIVGRTLQLLNEPAEDTLTATQVAKTFNMTTLDFNAVLRDMGSPRGISELTGKQHNDVLKAIRKMEPAWAKVTQGNFSLSTYQDATGRTLPCYVLTKTECLYIATKFNDEARAKLVLRDMGIQ